MSDLMTETILSMPYKLAMGSVLRRQQFYARARALLTERNSLAALLKRFVDGEHDQGENQSERHMYHDEAEALLAYLGGEVQGHTLVPDEILRKQYEQRKALVAENERLCNLAFDKEAARIAIRHTLPDIPGDILDCGLFAAIAAGMSKEADHANEA